MLWKSSKEVGKWLALAVCVGYLEYMEQTTPISQPPSLESGNYGDWPSCRAAAAYTNAAERAAIEKYHRLRAEAAHTATVFAAAAAELGKTVAADYVARAAYNVASKAHSVATDTTRAAARAAYQLAKANALATGTNARTAAIAYASAEKAHAAAALRNR